MRALLDTNVIIHRENKRVSNYSIGHLYRWLDKLKYEKVIHPYSVVEIQKYKDFETQESLAVKLEAYEVLKTIKTPDDDFLKKINIPENSENDRIDDFLLYEVYLGRVDLLITEDKGIRIKAARLCLSERVFSINAFISKVSEENPELIDYKMLAVKKTYFGQVDVNDKFFDSLRASYFGFNNWFNKKCDEEAYICKSDTEDILGFLYLKTEDEEEIYADIIPQFKPKRRLKVGTFKVEATGFRLGERFIKIIFDNALQRNVDEVYVTLFENRSELSALVDLIQRWGFINFGIKKSDDQEEQVYVKEMKKILPTFSCRKNFPNISYNCNKYILPILPRYHTSLLPDSKLNTENEIDFLGKEPQRYALQKVYITWAPCDEVQTGDLIVFYRIGEDGKSKKYASVVTTVAIIEEIIDNIKTEEELLSMCQNRSVFSTDDLRAFWRNHRYNLKVIRFIFVQSLAKRLTLGYLWDNQIIEPPGGPRPFTKITDEQYDMILRDSNTYIKYVER